MNENKNLTDDRLAEIMYMAMKHYSLYRKVGKSRYIETITNEVTTLTPEEITIYAKLLKYACNYDRKKKRGELRWKLV